MRPVLWEKMRQNLDKLIVSKQTEKENKMRAPVRRVLSAIYGPNSLSTLRDPICTRLEDCICPMCPFTINYKSIVYM